jgi:hypothetical protein
MTGKEARDRSPAPHLILLKASVRNARITRSPSKNTCNETIFPAWGNHPETPTFYQRTCTQIGMKVSGMFELAIALIALFSATIFLAHAVQAYRAR